MRIRTHKFFNAATRKAMFEKVPGYVDKSVDVSCEMARIRELNGLDRVYRFDLGENAEGCSPRVYDYLESLRSGGGLAAQLSRYPDRSYTGLIRKLSLKYQIPPEWFLVGAGLDSILDLVTRVFLDERDHYLMPIPTFFLFEEYSERMGAMPVFLSLPEEEAFAWSGAVFQQYVHLVDKFRPKLVWLANPNNPTGQFIQPELLEELVAFAGSYNGFVVVDEAYGEYTDRPGEVVSAARLLARHRNLMVLRTFSKKYGLASLRIAYLMASDPAILEALQVHRHYFPISQFSVDLAEIALEDEAFLEHSRARTAAQRREVFAKLSTLKHFSVLPSRSNIFMLKHDHLDGEALKASFEQRGIIASNLAISGIQEKGYARITLRGRDDNRYFCEACAEIDRGE